MTYDIDFMWAIYPDRKAHRDQKGIIPRYLGHIFNKASNRIPLWFHLECLFFYKTLLYKWKNNKKSTICKWKLVYHLPGLSFREFIELKYNIKLPVLPLNTILCVINKPTAKSYFFQQISAKFLKSMLLRRSNSRPFPS